MRHLWDEYCGECDAIVFVVDSGDTERLAEAADELWRVLELLREQAAPPAVAIMANKCDLKHAMADAELLRALKIEQYVGAHPSEIGKLANRSTRRRPTSGLGCAGTRAVGWYARTRVLLVHVCLKARRDEASLMLVRAALVVKPHGCERRLRSSGARGRSISCTR